MATEFYVNVDSIIYSSEIIGSIGRQAYIIESGMRTLIKDALIETFDEATYFADGDDGFPAEFQSHTMSVVRNFNEFYTTFDGGSVFVSVDFDAFGTREELERAYHQGARLADGGNLWGPYEGQELANSDDDSRHIFWEAIRFNAKKAYNPTTGKSMPTRKVPYPDWDEIKQQYINIWGPDKCPEWLLIQFGQYEYNPNVIQFNIVDIFQQRLNSLVDTMLYNFVASRVAIANSYESRGVSIGFSAGRPTLGAGQTYGVSSHGNPFRGGQFLPYKNL